VRAAAPGDEAAFVVLPDGTVLGEPPPEFPAALAAALEPPYRAEAVRRDGDTWALAACRIATVELPGLRGGEAELVVTREGRSLRVDGLPSFEQIPALDEAGAQEGPEHVVRATRLADTTWEVEATPL
jgi:hypothetical protein